MSSFAYSNSDAIEGPPDARLAQVVIRADFSTPDGRRTWWAIGGGDSIHEAVAWARDSLPQGEDWRLNGWRPLYGD
jgi:hypothetical protein